MFVRACEASFEELRGGIGAIAATHLAFIREPLELNVKVFKVKCFVGEERLAELWKLVGRVQGFLALAPSHMYSYLGAMFNAISFVIFFPFLSITTSAGPP